VIYLNVGEQPVYVLLYYVQIHNGWIMIQWNKFWYLV